LIHEAGGDEETDENQDYTGNNVDSLQVTVQKGKGRFQFIKQKRAQHIGKA
jgi:hypothetical protein